MAFEKRQDPILSANLPDLNTEINFGRRAAKEGFISVEQLLEILREYKQHRDKGEKIKISELLLQKKLLKPEDVEELKSLMHDEIVDLIEGYSIECKVGEGGMGTVYRAIQKSMNRTVALKILAPQFASDRQFVQRFFREAQAAGILNHPNIVQGFDSGVSGEHHYLAMEFVDGSTVEAELSNVGKYSEKKALNIALGVAKALEHAHMSNIIHRDIKPDNILIGQEGVVKLTDLGLARQMQDPNITQVGLAMGTPNYISPEQAKAEENIDIRSDLYSLGATLFHMVVGEVPFSGKSVEVILTKHVVEPPRSVRDIIPELSQHLDDLITKLMAKKPEDRFQTPLEVVTNIQGILDGTLVTQGRKDKEIMDRLRLERKKLMPTEIINKKVENVQVSSYLKKAKLKTIQKEYTANSIVFYEGQESDKIYLLLKGEIEVLRAGRAIENITASGQYFGDVSVLKKSPRDHTARAATNSVIVELSHGQYMKVLENSTSLCMNLITRLSAMLSETDVSLVRREQKLEAARTQLKIQKSRGEEAVSMISSLLNSHTKGMDDRRTKRLFYETVSMWIDEFSVREWIDEHINA